MKRETFLKLQETFLRMQGYVGFKNISDEMDDLKAELYEYDGYLAGIAISLMEGKKPVVKEISLATNLFSKAVDLLRDTEKRLLSEDEKRLFEYVEAERELRNLVVELSGLPTINGYH